MSFLEAGVVCVHPKILKESHHYQITIKPLYNETFPGTATNHSNKTCPKYKKQVQIIHHLFFFFLIAPHLTATIFPILEIPGFIHLQHAKDLKLQEWEENMFLLKREIFNKNKREKTSTIIRKTMKFNCF